MKMLYKEKKQKFDERQFMVPTSEYRGAPFWAWNCKLKKELLLKEIEEIIPHRHPFLLIDYIEDFKPGEFAVGYKCVTFREDFFKGHFPNQPVMPGVLIVEALAQVGAVAILSKKKWEFPSWLSRNESD